MIALALQGNVHVSEDGAVECQHGAHECEVNTLLQCALSIAAFTPAPAHAPPGQPPLTQSLLDCFFSQELSLHGRYPEVKTAADACIAAAGATPIVMFAHERDLASARPRHLYPNLLQLS